MAKKEMINNYIDSLEKTLESEQCVDVFELSDLVLEIIAVLKEDIPTLEDGVVLNNNTFERDARIIIAKLKMYLSNLKDDVISEPEPSHKRFWNSFYAWFESSETISKILKSEFIHYDNWNGGRYYLDIDFTKEFKIKYGENMSLEEIIETPTDRVMKMFIEVAYEKWIEVNKRYNFTIEVNERFSRFGIQSKLVKGMVLEERHQSTHEAEEIINAEMLEEKLEYSTKMISKYDLQDKKVALKIVVDCLQFLISIQEASNKKGQYQKIGRKIAKSSESKMYSVIATEIEYVMKVSNEYFDIRHNEKHNQSKEIREVLSNLQFVEYLYNRIYALVHLIKFNAN